MRTPGHDLYEVLGVSRATTTAELRRAYRRRTLQHHPDRAGPKSGPLIARIGGVWCRPCEYAGEVTTTATVNIQIPPAARHGAMTVGISTAGGRPPRIRLTIAP